MINIEHYNEQIIHESRSLSRGFTPIIVDMIHAQQTVKPVESVCEIGVSGGGKQLMWSTAMDHKFPVVGIDYIDPCDSQFEQTEPHHVYEIRTTALDWTSPYDNITLLLGKSGYITDTVTGALLHAPDKFDLVFDDGATGWPLMRESLSVWKRGISPTGCYISETPDGNGDTIWGIVPLEEHLVNLASVSLNTGMIIFDTLAFATPDGSMNGHYLGIWAPDMEIYKSVIQKYEQYIVFGRHYIEYLL